MRIVVCWGYRSDEGMFGELFKGVIELFYFLFLVWFWILFKCG